jgi:hypothetical protein
VNIDQLVPQAFLGFSARRSIAKSRVQTRTLDWNHELQHNNVHDTPFSTAARERCHFRYAFLCVTAPEVYMLIKDHRSHSLNTQHL